MVKFTKTKYSHLSGETRVRYNLDINEEYPDAFFVEASPKGVAIEGKILFTKQDHMESFAQAIGLAFKDNLQLKPQILASSGGFKA